MSKELSERELHLPATRIVELTIPQMGEGLQEALIIRLIKQPGSDIKQDEVLYEMETDKAVLEIESPYEGRLVEWLVKEGEVLPIGACLAKIEVLASSLTDIIEDCTEKNAPALKATTNFEKKNSKLDIRSIPPRVRSYCRQQNLSPETMLQIPYTGKKLDIEDVDNYLKKQGNSQPLSESLHVVELSSQQQALNYRFKRSAETVVPATLVSLIDLTQLKQAMQNLLTDEQQNFVSEFQVLAYIIGKVAVKFPKFRSRLIDSKTIHEYKHINLGIAVQTEERELLTAVITEADRFDFSSFINVMQTQIKQALQGKDQATERHAHLVLSYMGTKQVIFGAPVLVSPAIGTLFLGAALPYESKRLANLSLTFDHRIINGMDAADFLSAIEAEIQHISNLMQTDENPSQSSPALFREESKELITFKAWLLDTLGNLLDISPRKIDLTEPLGLQGMDSMKAVKLSSELGKYFDTKIPATLLWKYPNFKAMFDYFSQRFFDDDPGKQKNSGGEDLTELVKSLENLSSDRLKEILDKATL